MNDDFSANVNRIIGPLLSELGFVLDSVDDIDEEGRRGSVVYYESEDCKLQIYWSPRAGEINCMIAPLTAPNAPGLYDRSEKWHYLDEFIDKPNVPLEQLVKLLRAERAYFETEESRLAWLEGRIENNIGTARIRIRTMYE